MRKMFTAVTVIFFFVESFSTIYAAEYSDGRIKLVIDETIGRFSLYYMTDVEKRTYEPLFWEKDKRTSFISAFINGKEYKMGHNSEFRMVIRGERNKPALVFESQFLSITEEFSFIRTASSGVSNGVRVNIRVESWSPETMNVGVRLLIDTFLGEKSNMQFRTDLRPLGSETIIDKTSPEQYWVSQNDNYGLMGSIFVEGTESPDFLQFANWRRMNSSRYKVEYVQGRSFNYSPFSVKDSAVCYFLDIKPMSRWEQRDMTVLLAAEDNYGFDGGKGADGMEKEYPHPIIVAGDKSGVQPPVQSAAAATAPVEVLDKKRSALLPIGAMRVDIMTLRELVNKVDEYIYTGTMPSEEELKGMEAVVAKLKLRYGSVFSTF
jgi:hypothetical protein